ncbi:glycoside hydrolase family 95 protein [Microbacterium bovistercoris]|uniref:Glycoside hydrolase family 95 protein n=1 Tax=Microbacterium bovistercoris TaxID=2293570 RepID=A0A371NSH1_9MICO|nr:glycoside hydrolase N-terminal domain-containing protein [Microbacterium bovistercoris]REJ05033.1 glycoside hydrolase family 95 protein [Microbacterium bovistercoris]
MTRLDYDKPATDWLECLPLGNGSLGAMIDGGVDRLVVRLNHEAGWSGSPESEARGVGVTPEDAAAALAASREALRRSDAVAAAEALLPIQARYSQAFLPIGRLIVRRSATAGEYRRSLDLATSIHEMSTTDLTERTVVSAPLGVLAIETSVRPTIELETELAEIGRSSAPDGIELLVRFPSDVAPAHEAGFAAAEWDETEGAALRGVILARAQPSDGGWLILLAAETTFEGFGGPLGSLAAARERARRRIDAAVSTPAEEIFRAASAEHARLFDRARLRFDAPVAPAALIPDRLASAFADPEHPLAADPGLGALLFDVGRYLLICSSRPGGVPATLQGIWNDSMRPPWSSNYTININTQMNYWSAHSTNLSEAAGPLFDFVEGLSAKGQDTARRLYGAGGWTAHHNSDIWLFSSPVGAGAGDARWVHWPMAAPWLVRSLWDAVEFGAADADELRRLWPIARGAAEFVLDWQHRDGQGWSTSPSTSPENTYLDDDGREVALDTVTAMDLQLIRDLLGIVRRLADLVDAGDDEIVRRAGVRLEELPADPAATADGIIREWSEDRREADPQHRHVSSLYGLYPGDGRWSEDALQAAVRALERRGDDSTGWSLVWKLYLWARLRRADKVSDLLALVFREAGDRGEAGGLYPNMFAAHPPFQIDANLGFPGALVECLLQSHDGIELLPAVPRQLASGSATGLRARPGVDVDLTWDGGELVEATLRSAEPVTVMLRYGGEVTEVRIDGEARIRPADFRRSA